MLGVVRLPYMDRSSLTVELSRRVISYAYYRNPAKAKPEVTQDITRDLRDT